MPQYGKLDVDALADRLPEVGPLADESWTSEQTEVLNLCYEFDDTQYLELIPPALHPSIPLYGNIMLRSHAESPVGPFALAELRVIARAGVHQGGFTCGAFASTPQAVEFLRQHYGWPVRQAEVRIERRHYAVLGRVELAARPVLDVALERSEPISGEDVLYPVSIHLARVDGEPQLVQVEPRYTAESAERGRPRVNVFDAEAFGDARIKLTNPLPATWLRSQMELGRVRWLMDPKRPAVAGAVRRPEPDA